MAFLRKRKEQERTEKWMDIEIGAQRRFLVYLLYLLTKLAGKQAGRGPPEAVSIPSATWGWFNDFKRAFCFHR